LRDQPDDRHALLGNDLAQRIEADLGLALGERRNAAVERVGKFQFRFHRLGDAELLPHLGEVSAARRGRRVGVNHGLRVEHRLLERLKRGNVRLRGALAHDHRNAHGAELRPGIATEGAILHPRFDRWHRHQHHVGLFAG
jgi:hypothetical protein